MSTGVWTFRGLWVRGWGCRARVEVFGGVGMSGFTNLGNWENYKEARIATLA